MLDTARNSAATVAAGWLARLPDQAVASTGPLVGGLAARLAKKDPSELRNRIFNKPPAAQVYPKWLHGEWNL